MVMPILMIFLTITTAGIPIAVSKLVSKENSRNNYNGVRKIYYTSVIVTILISSLLSSILYFSSEFISVTILKNSNTYNSILLLCPAIIIISLSSVIRGFYYGLKRVKQVGIALILEQLTRILFVLGLIYYIDKINSTLGAFIAICGISFGEFFGLSWLILNNKIKKDKISKYKISLLSILTQLLYIGFPITISRIINVSLQLANAVIIPQRLVFSGLNSSEAISTYGRVVGMALPFIFLPFIVTTALVVNIIPNISEKIELKQYESIKSDINIAIRTTLLIAFPITLIYIFYSREISFFIYKDELVGNFMRVMAFSTIFLSLQHTLSGILQGLGKQVASTINFIIGMIFQLLCTYFLVGHPEYRIYGFFIGFIVGNFVICGLNYNTLKYHLNMKMDILNWILKPLFASIIMIVSINFSSIILNGLPRLLLTLLYLIIGLSTYLFIMFLTNGIPLEIFKSILKKEKKR